jgi:hypothetical protein
LGSVFTFYPYFTLIFTLIGRKLTPEEHAEYSRSYDLHWPVSFGR